MGVDTEVAIVGAGPYGLSIAAHLRARHVAFRIFGQPMQTWRTAMPRGMFLKSEGFASALYDPERSFSLRDYCAEHDLAYADIGTPVPLEVFASYGLAFQQRFVADLDERSVANVAKNGDGFALRLEDSDVLTARNVVLAIGISPFAYVPSVLAGLPDELGSHSSEHACVDRFVDRDVAVIGGGSSALDLAALLRTAGARPVVVVRESHVDYHERTKLPRSFVTRVRKPLSCIGQDWRRRIFTDAPLFFHALPRALRLHEIKTTMAPAAGWFVKDDVEGHVPFYLSRSLKSARVVDGRVRLELTDGQVTTEVLNVDHVIAATGYRVDIDRVEILDEQIRAEVTCDGHAPALSTNFESSLEGLYFVGVSAMNSFGPVFRFACGAEYTARRLSRHLARSSPVKLAAGSAVTRT